MNDPLHAMIAWAPQVAIGPGPLSGMTVAIKDVVDVAGLPTTGNAALFADAPPALADAPAVVLLRAAGAAIIGKANCWEMSVGGPSRESPFSPAVNPWGPGADPGGSSSGSAVAVAAGIADAALGGDTGGSIRLPASFCGVVGFKPTHGVVPMAGALPFAESLDVLGPIARTAAACARVFAVLSATEVHAPVALAGLRLGVPQTLLDHAPPGEAMARSFAAARAALAGAGASVTEVALPSAAVFNRCYFLIARAEAFARWRETLAAHPDQLNPLTRRSLALGALIPDDAVADARRRREELRAELAAAMAGVDALILPTTPDEASDLDLPDHFSRPDTAPYARPFSLAGVPAVSVPCGLGARGRPLGLQIVGRHGADARLLAIATAVQQVLPQIGEPQAWWR